MLTFTIHHQTTTRPNQHCMNCKSKYQNSIICCVIKSSATEGHQQAAALGTLFLCTHEQMAIVLWGCFGSATTPYCRGRATHPVVTLHWCMQQTPKSTTRSSSGFDPSMLHHLLD
ncbi:hypothetical protein CEXT_485081 [Caerostris extrusa]|uniref:Uncharacterized protein n=1 Tax=Caerostris extrusa TaxID=172846 RepID=A0AAV4Q8H0_CAEEX|nr:hypothetical protein CEXT_485081 [Caerostris extrusa]